MSELRHYGIMGMKWGVRRYQNADGTLTAAGRERYGSVDESSERARSKSAREMSDKELNDSINRIRKEQEYDSLTKTGQQKAIDTIKKYGGKIAGTIVLGTAGALATRYIYGRINPKNGQTAPTITGDIKAMRDRHRANAVMRSASRGIGAAREARRSAAQAAAQAAEASSENMTTADKGATWLARMISAGRMISAYSDQMSLKQGAVM